MKLYSLIFLPLAFGLPTQDSYDPKDNHPGKGFGNGHGHSNGNDTWPGKHPEYPPDYTNDPKARAAAVKEAFQYAWDGYYKSASQEFEDDDPR